MTTEQSIQALLQDMATLKSDNKTIFKRLDKAENVIEQIHKMSVNLDNLSKQLEKYVQSSEVRGKEQGQRIGKIENKVQTIQSNEKRITELCAKVDELRLEPAKKWQKITFEVVRWAVLGALAILAASQFIYIGVYYP